MADNKKCRAHKENPNKGRRETLYENISGDGRNTRNKER
jgi:hypothetical protein